MSKNLVPASVTFPNDLLAEIDKRAVQVDMTRSQYLRYLARKDLAQAKVEAESKQQPGIPEPQAKAA